MPLTQLKIGILTLFIFQEQRNSVDKMPLFSNTLEKKVSGGIIFDNRLKLYF